MMPRLRKGIAIYFFTSIAILLSLLLVSVFLFSKIYLAKKLESLVVDISKEKGYEVRIGHIAFGFLSGLEVEKIEIFDSSDPNAHPIKIGELIVKPDIPSSIVKRKLEIEEVLINDVDLSFPKVGFEKVKKLSAEITQERLAEGEEKFLSIAISTIELNRADIEVSDGVKLYIGKLDFRLGDYGSEDQENIDVKGTAIFLNNEIGIDGLINTSSTETNGELNVNVAECKMGFLSSFLANRENPALNAHLSFRIAEAMSSSGRIRIGDGEESVNARPPVSTEVLYDVTYDKISDTLSINTFNLEMEDFLLAKFDGSIDSIGTEGVFNIGGSVSTTPLEDVIRLFHGFSHVDASGKVEAKDLKLTGSMEKGDITLSGKAVLSGVDIDDSERDIRVSKLGGTLDFKKIISRSVSSGLSVRGKLNSRNVVTKIGFLEDLHADLEFRTDGRWNGSELSLSLNGVKVRTGADDTIEISKLKTTEPIMIIFHGKSNNSSGEGGNQIRRDKISFTSGGLTFRNTSYRGFRIESGVIDHIAVLYETNQRIFLELTCYGSRIRNMDESIYVDALQVNLTSAENGEFILKGDVDLKAARYGDFKFPAVKSDYRFENDAIKLINLEARLAGLGELRVSETMIIFGGKGDRFSSKIEFSKGSYSGPQYGIESKGVGGELIFYKGRNEKTDWNGNLFFDEVNIKSQSARKISLKIDSSSDGIKLDDLQGRVFGGRLGGGLLFNTGKPHSLISSSIIMEDASIPYKSNVFFLESMAIDFKGTLDRGLTPQGKGELRIENLRIGDNGGTSSIGSGVKFQTINETLLLKEGFIKNGDGQRIEFSGRLENLLDKERVLKINSNRIPLPVVRNILSPFLPEWVREGELMGDVSLDMVFDHVLNKNATWKGKLSIADTSFAGAVSRVPVHVAGVNGVVTFDEYSESGNLLAPLLRKHHKLDREVFERFLSLLNDTNSYGKNNFLTIDELRYGFLSLDDVECMFEIVGLKFNLNQCASNLFDGRIYVAGSFDYASKKDRYNLSVLFKDISLEDISNRVNSIKDYITGRINGLVWVSGSGQELKTIDGLFEFWSIRSRKESRKLGKAFLEKLGAKSRFFVGSSRGYDKAEISGYIKDGVMTFSEFDISNRVLGYQNLSIKVDPRRNTISLAHLFSVIREISRRAGEGRLQIDLENKRN